ncbi:KICSTOR subunit 2-like [Liolophura sinensis]|uniref:KICSTOR subunit 2-like n=1 Tax=Liolophura sinensis TaxID=3198878 RepID=UPI0031586B85
MSENSTPAASPVGPREEEFLDQFFKHISQFAFDKAKELAEKERDTHKASFGSSWGLVVHSLCFFALAEKTYMSLTFLGQKWFGRAKDNPRNSYSSLYQEFKKVEENDRIIDMVSSDPTREKILAHISGQLCQFLTARQKSMDFYEQMSTMGSNRNLSYEDLVTLITDLIQTNQKSFHHPVLSSLKSSFSLECEIIHHLLLAQIKMVEWQFLPALLQLHEAHTKLQSWGATALAKESRKSAFGSISLKQSSLPALYQWLVKFKGSLLSKFTLYFYETLAKQSNTVEMKGLTAKATEDFVSKIVSFHKKSDATNVSLVLDIQGIESTYKGPGYHHPHKQTELPKGLGSYPAIFSYPSERPAQHWPTVVMMMTDRSADLASDKAVCIYDKTAQSTYFIIKVEQRIALVVIFESKKSEKDSYVNNFMTDMHTHLKGAKLFASLKPGLKG